jgi:hypothetical protein
MGGVCRKSVEEMRTVYRDLVGQCEEKIRPGWPGLSIGS